MKDFNWNLINEKDHLLLAVSGGIDSVVLLHYLYTHKTTLDLSISVAHIDHKKRSNSGEDAAFVKKLCQDYNIPFYLYELEPIQNQNFHDYAHKERYDFLSTTAKKIKAQKIVLAHHLDDLAETILMRLIRGSSFEGYQGIMAQSIYKDVHIIRPMLNVAQAHISHYQKTHALAYKEDESNFEDDYTRNRYRHQIMPLLQDENPKYRQKLKQFASYQKDAYDLINHQANLFINAMDHQDDDYHLNLIDFTKEFRIVQIEILKKMINQLTDNTLELSYQNLKDIIDIIYNDKPNLSYEISDQLYLYKSYQKLYFKTQRITYHPYQLELHDLGEYIINNTYDVNISKKPNKNYEYIYKLCYNNLDLLFPLTIRNRRDGDRIDIQIGTKKLKDFFIDHKVPRDKRNQVPLILSKKKEILYIPGMYQKKKSGKYSIYINIKKANN